MKKLSSMVTTGFNGFFFLIFSGLLVSNLCFNNATFPISLGIRLLGFFLVAIALIFLASANNYIYEKNRKFRKFADKILRITIVISLVILLLLQLTIAASISTDIGWDCGAIMVAARASDMNYYAEYFSIYPNNLFLLFIFRFIIMGFTKLGISNIWLGFSVLNILAIDSSILLAVLFARKMWGKKVALYALLISALLFGLSPWMIVPYSDTLSMPFVMLSLYLYGSVIKMEKKSSKMIAMCGLGASLAIGALIKPTVLVVGVAIAITQLLRILARVNAQRCTRQLGYGALAMAVGFAMLGSYSWFRQDQGMIVIDPQRAMPASGFIMMGLTTSTGGANEKVYGAWNQQDIDLLFAEHTTPAMAQMAKEEIAERLHAMGPLGYAKYLSQKARWITADGAFYWAGEGHFADWKWDKENIAKQFYYPAGRYYPAYLAISQAIWSATLFLLVMSSLYTSKQKNGDFAFLLRLAVFGVLLFILVFEGRSRYLFNYLPAFAVLAALGLATISNTIQHIENNYD